MMKLKRGFCKILLGMILLISSVSWAGFFDGKTDFYTIKTEHFYIHFPVGLEDAAEQMRGIVEQVHARLTARLEWAPKRRTHIVLTDKSEASNGLATVLPDNYILLYMAMPTPDTTLDHYRDYYEYLFTHEYTHILHIDQAHRVAGPGRLLLGKIVAPNASTPAWMREGMAVYEESELAPGFGRNNSPYADMVLRTAHYENKFPRIDQIAGSSVHFPAGSGPYLFGGKFFQWLAKNYGEDRMYQYQKEYASGMWFYSLNNKARRVYGKSFYKLWKEFSRDTLSAALETKDRLMAEGSLTNLTDFLRGSEDYSSFTLSSDAKNYAYFAAGYDRSARIAIHVAGQSEPHELQRRVFGQMSFSQNGRYLAFASLAAIETKTSLAEVYYYDTKEKKLWRVMAPGFEKKSMRVMDPDFSPADGGSRWLVMVRNMGDTDQLYIFDLFEKRGYTLTNLPKKTQLASPRFSPDGNHIVASLKDPTTGHRDIVIFSNTGVMTHRISDDIAIDSHPVFARDGRSVYFSSSRSGIYNIHAYDLESKTSRQVSHVLTGLFQPQINNVSGEIFVQTYTSGVRPIQKFHDVRSQSVVGHQTTLKVEKNKNQTSALAAAKMSHGDEGNIVPDSLYQSALNPKESAGDAEAFLESHHGNHADANSPPSASGTDSATIAPAASPRTYPSSYKDLLVGKSSASSSLKKSLPADAKKYHAFPQILRPGYVLPNLEILESTVLTSLTLGRTDPLYRHSWVAFVNYRSDAQFVGGGGTYLWSRYDPTYFIGGVRYPVNWGTINTGVAIGQFFEERWQAYAGVTKRFGMHQFTGTYFYEHRSALTNLAGVNLVNMHPYAGLRLVYQMGSFKKYPDSISPEDSYLLRVTSELTDSVLMSDDVNEEFTTVADARYYFAMPWSKHHVFAVRAMMGWQWGDLQQFGTFRMGGPFGEGIGAAKISARVFPLRGLPGITFGGDRAALFSAEYRLPLKNNVNRGPGTFPVFMDKLYLNLFTDAGSIEYRNAPGRNVTNDIFDRILVSVGAELRADLVIGYGLPLTARLGYGVLLMDNGRTTGLTDGTTTLDLKYGSPYLQVGTSF